LLVSNNQLLSNRFPQKILSGGTGNEKWRILDGEVIVQETQSFGLHGVLAEEVE